MVSSVKCSPLVFSTTRVKASTAKLRQTDLSKNTDVSLWLSQMSCKVRAACFHIHARIDINKHVHVYIECTIASVIISHTTRLHLHTHFLSFVCLLRNTDMRIWIICNKPLFHRYIFHRYGHGSKEFPKLILIPSSWLVLVILSFCWTTIKRF